MGTILVIFMILAWLFKPSSTAISDQKNTSEKELRLTLKKDVRKLEDRLKLSQQRISSLEDSLNQVDRLQIAYSNAIHPVISELNQLQAEKKRALSENNLVIYTQIDSSYMNSVDSAFMLYETIIHAQDEKISIKNKQIGEYRFQLQTKDSIHSEEIKIQLSQMRSKETQYQTKLKRARIGRTIAMIGTAIMAAILIIKQ